MKKIFKSLGLAALITATVPYTFAQGTSDITIYGSMTDNDTWSGWDTYEGIYSFHPVEGTSMTAVYTDGWDLAATSGGVLVDDVYHLFNYRGGSSMFSVTYTSFKISDWSTVDSYYCSEVFNSNDMAYDHVTDRVYCAQKNGKRGKIAIWNPNQFDQISEVGTTTVEILAIAADAEGKLFGVGSDGMLYAIDKSNASLTLIGDTGLKPKEGQSAVFDFATGVLYLAAYCTNKTSALYTIDLATGAATKVTDFPDNAKMRGLYMLTSSVGNDVPAAVTDLRANFDAGKNDGNVTFTMPNCTVGGAQLSGQLEYNLTVDGAEMAQGMAEAGQPVTIELTLPSGEHQFTLVTVNAAGESQRAKCKAYVGKGIPGYVASPSASLTGSGNEVIVSWKAPDYCMPLEAYFDPTEVRYDVVRMPDNVVIADHIAECTVTDNIDYEGQLKLFSYEITASVDNLSGYATTTNSIAVGDALQPPFEASMASYNLGFFTIIDANHDGNTWCKDFYGYGVGCGGRWDGDCDDWLILPPLHLENTGVYHAIITVGNDYDGPSKWELMIGTAPTAEAMTQTLMAPTSTVNSFDGDIKVSAPGTYYIGIHCIGAAGTTMYVADIIVRDESNNDAPDAPIDVRGVGVERGELAAYVTFTTPSLTIGGDRLDALSSVNIYRGEKLVYTLDGVEPDTEYTCKVEAEQEFNSYSVAAVNEFGEGRRATVDYVFAGLDYPATVTNFTFTENIDGQPLLSWDPTPQVGLFGYYVDPTDVVYEIYRGYGDDTYDLVEEAFIGTEYVDTYLSPKIDQFMLQYYIYPVNSIGRGYGTSSNTDCFGRPFDAPFVETFSNGNSDMSPWYYRANNPENTGWTLYRNTDTTIDDYDGTNGLMAFHAIKKGDEATLYAPFVSVKGVSDPILDFYYYKAQMTTPVTVTANGDPLTNISDGNETTGWCRFKASLADYNKLGRVKLEFKATATGESYAFIDNVRVRQQLDNDLALMQLHVPTQMSLGQPSTITAVVKNDGEKVSSPAKVSLYRNGFVVAQADIDALDTAAKVTVDFVEIPDVAFGESPVYYVTVEAENDNDDTNDSSAEVSSSIVMPRYPAPDQLTADVNDGGVTLAWSKPQATWMAPDPIVEDFESYESFATEIAPWTLVDGDKKATTIMADPVTWYEDLVYPNSGEPMAYQVFDPAAAGIDYETYDEYAPYSGKKALVSWSAADFSTNDDWLISPELFAGGQTISFYVYSRGGFLESEKYEVLYSATDTDINSFIQLTKGNASREWTKVSVDLPADAKYFAIRTVSNMSNLETWYDDISFIPATSPAIPLELFGFNVYRDNVRINTELITEAIYIDTQAASGEHKYNVTAVYGVGESTLSNDAMVEVTGGIGDALAAKVSVVGEYGAIRISGAAGRSLRVNTVSGMNINSIDVIADVMLLPMTPGIYLVTVNGSTYKVAVK